MSGTSKRKVDSRILVETPEGVDFEFVLAGPGKRSAAFIADLFIKAGFLSLGVVLPLALSPGRPLIFGVGVGLWLALWFVVDWFYGSIFESMWNGQTPGKRLYHLRVIRTNGTPITSASAIGRNFLLAADSQPLLICGLYTVGLISMLATRRMQRIGDLVFDTMVVDESRERASSIREVVEEVEPLLRSECTRRFAVPERTLALIERLFDDTRLIPDGLREVIATPLSISIRKRMGISESSPIGWNLNGRSSGTALRHTYFLLRVLKTFSSSDIGTPGPVSGGGGRSE